MQLEIQDPALQLLVDNQDGFALAEGDMYQRGFGDPFPRRYRDYPFDALLRRPGAEIRLPVSDDVGKLLTLLIRVAYRARSACFCRCNAEQYGISQLHQLRGRVLTLNRTLGL